MKNIKRNAFTLVELLVVITILAIISVVAYQSFWGATDKAVWARKISDVSTIESSLQQYKINKNHYPKVDEYNASTNMWGYNSWATAKPSNTIRVTMNWAEIATVVSADWGWRILNSDDQQIWAKWVVSQDTLWKQYLSTDLYDPEVWKEKETSTNEELVKRWIGRYVYAVYKKPTGATWSWNKGWTYYNIAYTVKKEDSDTYITKIVWDYDQKSCFENAWKCPLTLIWSWSWATRTFLVNEQEIGKNNDWTNISGNFGSSEDNQWIPYAVWDFDS